MIYILNDNKDHHRYIIIGIGGLDAPRKPPKRCIKEPTAPKL